MGLGCSCNGPFLNYMPIEIADSPVAEDTALQLPSTLSVPVKRALICLALAIAAVLIHGYHPFAVDGSIYVPAIKKQLNPELYPQNAEFFLFPARLSVFAAVVAGSVRATHIPLEYMLLLWHLATIAVFLAACWRLCRMFFSRDWEALQGTLLMAALLTIPVAGTSLMVSDPYLTSRSFSTPAVLMAICCVLENKTVRAALWLLAAALVHPLMAVFGGTFVIILYAIQKRSWVLLATTVTGGAATVIAGIWWARGVVVSPEYRAAVLTRSYFFLSRWEWYEIFGLIAPLVLFAAMLWLRRRDADRRLRDCLFATLVYGTFFLLIGAIISGSTGLLVIAKFQPLRAYHLLYVLLFLLPVNAFLMKVARPMAAVAVLLVVAAGMFFVQQQTFPASAHVEWPWSEARNNWVQAFDWVRNNTPVNAVFALDGRYTETSGEDCQGFSARAERSSLADVSKAGGVAALFPSIASDWARETQADSLIPNLGDEKDMRALVQSGASWVLLRRDEAAKLDCPYQNAAVAVCRLQVNEASDRLARAKGTTLRDDVVPNAAISH